MDQAQPAAARRQRAGADPGLRRGRHRGARPSRPPATRTYFPVLGALVRYPGWLVWPFAVLAAARRRRARPSWPAGAALASWPRLAAGFGLALIPLAARAGCRAAAVAGARR